mmetsp:Transcript_11311/g.34480  ORF Transcript_11311/g.34480 Transcript_11311/m.34480 type:complete len:309 (+) Transcript_11311:539-1465(+)
MPCWTRSGECRTSTATGRGSRNGALQRKNWTLCFRSSTSMRRLEAELWPTSWSVGCCPKRATTTSTGRSATLCSRSSSGASGWTPPLGSPSRQRSWRSITRRPSPACFQRAGSAEALGPAKAAEARGSSSSTPSPGWAGTRSNWPGAPKSPASWPARFRPSSARWAGPTPSSTASSASSTSFAATASILPSEGGNRATGRRFGPRLTPYSYLLLGAAPPHLPRGGAQWIRHFPGLPVSTAELVRRALGVARACVLYLPKQSYGLVGEIMKEAGVGAEDFLVEKNYVYVSFEDKPRQKQFVAITVYAFR